METPQLNQLMIIATALSTKSLHPKLNHCQSAHLFTTELSIPVLNQVLIYFPFQIESSVCYLQNYLVDFH